ncbi:DUF1565 domain-containing protein [Calothrix sp. NIES-2098]|uniref:DUF1565 domain-containing protein n=1 Tax=Calothrix sp. NIES-2098 TaxID=1954171 RepID=UPI000B603D1D|nr:hypothetical protein NIES2098_45920 [Calothrix sp. NIES-2098]
MISPIVFPRNRRSEVLSVTAVAKGDRPDLYTEFRLHKLFRASVLSLSIGISLATLTLLGISFGSAFAQVPPAGEKQLSQVNVLFVNPATGEDKEGNGSDRTPLKTITQALQKATGNTVITLAPGTYSAETGESFPLILRQGVSIQGDASDRGKGITIQGGGEYLSRSFGGQNVTIVGANQAGLTGVTVTNPNRRGYGLWIESSNPVVSQNTFTGNTQDGVFVTGNATPTISQNSFYRNGANGITIAGTSQAQVRENLFQETGFGINIAQNATPVISNNQIQNNRAGIIVQANARPVLRNNIIEGSKEDGMVAIAQAMPDLGNDSEPGGNQFRNNTRYDINASAAKQVIAAVGNTLTSNRIAGKVEMKAPTTTTAIARNAQPAAGGPEDVPTNGEIIFSAPGLSETPNNLNVPSANNSNSGNNLSIGKLNPQLLPLLPANTSRVVPTLNPPPPTPTVNSPVPGFPVPSSLSGRQTPINPQVPPTASMPPVAGNSPDTPQLNYIQVNTNAIEFAPPQPPSNSVVKPRATGSRGKKQPSQRRQPAPPVGNSNLLPVPNSNIPMGNTRNMRKVPVPASSPVVNYGGSLPNNVNVAPMGTGSLPPSAVPMGSSPLPAGVAPMGSNPTQYGAVGPMGVRYRVLVEVATERDQELVRYLAPGAFPTVSQGRNFMQVGVFSNRSNAEGMMNSLNSSGLRAIFEVLN